MSLRSEKQEKLNVAQNEETREIQRNNPDDLNELKTLLNETRDLNDLMRGYIRTNMDKATAEKMTFDTEIDHIKTTSQQVTDQMLLILAKQESLLRENAEVLQKVLSDSQCEMSRNNNQVLEEMKAIKGDLNSNMKALAASLENEVSSMSRNTNDLVNEASRKAEGLIFRARKGVWMNDWLDVAKYGLGTAVFVVPLYIGVKYLFAVFGLDMP